MAIELQTPTDIIEPARTIGQANRFQVPSFTFIDQDGQTPYAEIGCQAVFVTRDTAGNDLTVQPVHSFTVRVEGDQLAPFAGLWAQVRTEIYNYLVANGHFPSGE